MSALFTPRKLFEPHGRAPREVMTYVDLRFNGTYSSCIHIISVAESCCTECVVQQKLPG